MLASVTRTDHLSLRLPLRRLLEDSVQTPTPPHGQTGLQAVLSAGVVKRHHEDVPRLPLLRRLRWRLARPDSTLRPERPVQDVNPLHHRGSVRLGPSGRELIYRTRVTT